MTVCALYLLKLEVCCRDPSNVSHTLSGISLLVFSGAARKNCRIKTYCLLSGTPFVSYHMFASLKNLKFLMCFLFLPSHCGGFTSMGVRLTLTCLAASSSLPDIFLKQRQLGKHSTANSAYQLKFPSSDFLGLAKGTSVVLGRVKNLNGPGLPCWKIQMCSIGTLLIHGLVLQSAL